MVAMKLNAQDALYVLDLIKLEILISGLEQKFKPKLSDKPPTEMKG